MISLQARLNRGLVAILILVFASQWALGSYAIRRVVEHEMVTRLEHDGDSLLASLDVDANGEIRFDPFRLGLIYEQLHSGHYFVIRSGGRMFRSRSLGAENIPTYPLSPGYRRQYHCDGPEAQPLLALARGFTIRGRDFTVTIAEELTAIEKEIIELSLGYLVLTLSVLTVAIVLQSLDVARALRPLSGVRRELAGIARGEMARIECGAPAEIRPLVDELNRLLVLMERRLRQSRTAVGNLAHALKTPLAILFRAASDPGLADAPELSRQLREQTAAIHRRIERELKQARLAGAGGSASFFNPGEELSVLVRVLANVHAEKRLDIRVIAPDRRVPWDREDALELIGNLADNACKWATGQVLIRVECEDGITVEVDDDGPGCAAGELEQLARRGVRLDESRPGHGLGLAIVRDIAEFYGGRVEFGRSRALGGLSVRVALPGFSHEAV